MEKVSVIIPTYNRANLIERSIRSVLTQNYQELEVIVVDDGSVDATEDVVRAIRDERIIYDKQTHNQGVAAARNKGVKLASGEWIAFHDSDDCWREDKLSVQMRYAKEHPEYRLIYCAYLCHTFDGKEIKVPGEELKYLEGDVFAALLARNTVGAPTILMRREDFLASGGFDTTLKSLEDWEYVLRFSKEHMLGYVDRILVDAYLSNSGVSSGKGAYAESRCRMIANYYQELLYHGMAETVVGDLLSWAEKMGVSEAVKRMLLLYLQKR